MAAPTRTLPASTSDDPIQAVRRFNRFYTRQIGVLQEHLLESQLSLTEVRVLYELAHRDNVTAVELRQELGLDRGYLSRMLQNFEKQGWIETTPSPSDRRRIFLSLTGNGERVFVPLERRSSEEVAAMLARLSPSQQEELLGAMGEIEGILDPASELHTSGSPTLSQRTRKGGAPAWEGGAPDGERTHILRQHRHGDMGWVVYRHGLLYSQEYKYDERFEALVAGIVAEFVENYNPARERCWMAECDGQVVGSVFLVEKSKTVAKLRLLLVEPSARGMGIGKHLVAECIRFARKAGYKTMMLWTQSELTAARKIYQHAGFQLVGKKAHDSWGRKGLVAETWRLKL